MLLQRQHHTRNTHSYGVLWIHRLQRGKKVFTFNPSSPLSSRTAYPVHSINPIDILYSILFLRYPTWRWPIVAVVVIREVPMDSFYTMVTWLASKHLRRAFCLSVHRRIVFSVQGIGAPVHLLHLNPPATFAVRTLPFDFREVASLEDTLTLPFCFSCNLSDFPGQHSRSIWNPSTWFPQLVRFFSLKYATRSAVPLIKMTIYSLLQAILEILKRV